MVMATLIDASLCFTGKSFDTRQGVIVQGKSAVSSATSIVVKSVLHYATAFFSCYQDVFAKSIIIFVEFVDVLSPVPSPDAY